MTTKERTKIDGLLCDLYLRLSDGRNENGTFAEREETLRHKASTLGWRVHRVVIENDLMSGSKSASAFKRRKLRLPDGSVKMRVYRPGFRSILDDLAAGTVQAVLAEDLDRTMRDPRDAEDMIDVIRARRAYADSLSGSLKFTAGGTDSEVMQARILVSVAHKSSSDTARRVAGGRKRTAERGGWAGGRRPYGFDTVSRPSGNHRNSELAVNDAEAAEIRRAAEQVLANVPLRSIARDMRERGVATVTGVQWTAQTLRDMLLRELNAGIVVYQGEETGARLPGDPILHEDVWRAVISKLTDPARSHPGRAPRWLLTGIARCVCGAAMEIQAGKGRAHAYRCSKEGGTGDIHVRRNAAALDTWVRDYVIERMSRPDAADLACPPTVPGVDMHALREQRTLILTEIDQWDNDRSAQRVTYARWLKQTTQLNATLTAIEADLASVTDRSPLSALAHPGDPEAVACAWERMSLGEQRGAIELLMCVTVLPATHKGRGFDHNAVRIEPRR